VRTKHLSLVTHEHSVTVSVKSDVSSPYGPVRAGLTTSQITPEARLTELLNSLESVEPEFQILHGLRYLDHRYGKSACRALKHSDRRGWY